MRYPIGSQRRSQNTDVENQSGAVHGVGPSATRGALQCEGVEVRQDGVEKSRT
jgi:hypothetical protein